MKSVRHYWIFAIGCLMQHMALPFIYKTNILGNGKIFHTMVNPVYFSSNKCVKADLHSMLVSL